jgi:hypothetical protein
MPGRCHGRPVGAILAMVQGSKGGAMKTLLTLVVLPLLLLAPPAVAAEKGKVCGGVAGLACPSGQYCDWPANRCNAADVQGRCVKVPEVCTQVYQPVCGCNGRTYSNDCMRLMARVRKASDGPCR